MLCVRGGAAFQSWAVGIVGEVLGALAAVVDVSLVSEPELVVPVEGSWRFMVGRSGSSAGVLPVWVLAVVEESVPEFVVPEVSRRFMVGRSGSSEALPALVTLGLFDAVVVEPELSRRFIVGRSASSSVAVLFVPEVVESVVLPVVVGGVVGVPGLLGAVDVEEVVSPLVVPLFLVTRCGRLGSDDMAIAGTFLDGFNAWVVFLGAARGLTLP